MVYIDDMNAPYGRMRMFHMIADTEEELHLMADKIGVARKWYQGNHYDVCTKMKRLALDLGAIEITMKQCAAMVAHHRVNGFMCKPEVAISWYKNRK